MSFAESRDGMASLVHFMVGWQIVAQKNLTVADNGYTLKPNDERQLLLDSTGGAFEVKFPALPDDNETFFVKMLGSANTVTLNGNGKLIEGAATYGLSAAWRARVFQFVKSLNQWVVIMGVG